MGIVREVKPESRKLNMGCGFRKLSDHWNVDVEKKCNPDQVLDLEQTPWPFEDDSFDRITADNVLEHLGQTPRVFTAVMKEMYRVSNDGAEWFINVPHHRCDLYWDDYTHVRVLTPKTFKMFDQKFNYETIERKLSESTFGIYHSMDIELVDVTYNIVPMWRQQVSEGTIGHRELDLKLNTMANIAESVNIFLKVHKPGRFEHLIS